MTGWQGIGSQSNRLQEAIERGSWLPKILLVLLAFVPVAWPQSEPAPATLDSEQIVQRLMERNQERAAALQHYTSKRSYHLEYHGFPGSQEATMDVAVNFDAPASKQFTIVRATGSKLIQNRVFHRLLEREE